MKRDMDLIRQICFAAEELAPGEMLEDLPDVGPDVFAEHVLLMRDQRLAECIVVEALGGERQGWVKRLTADGHDFIDAARSDLLWNKVKKSIISTGSSLTIEVLKAGLKAEVAKRLPGIGDLT